jgi:leucyl aminopeptidase
MQILVQKGDLTQEKCDLVVVNEFQGVKELGGASGAIDKATDGLITQVMKEEGFTGKSGESILIRTEGVLPAKRVMVVGLGKKENFGMEAVREATAVSFTAAKKLGLKKIVSILHGAGWGDLKAKDAGQAMSEGIYLAAYQYDRFKKMKTNKVEDFIIITRRLPVVRQAEKGIELGSTMAAATVTARNLVNTPAQYMKPIDMVEAAKTIAKNSEGTVKVKVMDREQLEKMGAGAFLAIAQGADSEPYMVHLKYTPEGAKKKLALVGKAVTFDAGGLQLKSHSAMMELGTMKVDMAGAAVVLGVFSALSALKPKIAIEGVFAACENMVSGNAIRPGDVITAMNKKTIEILHTDAEGRITLADSLYYAANQKPDAIIDMATLTMSVIYALGEQINGVMGNNEKLLDKIFSAGELSGERFWELPLDEPFYRKALKSKIADTNNLGGRGAGATKAALFLEKFINDLPWAHIDLGGPTFAEKPLSAYSQYGATGTCVRTMLELIRKY